MIRHRCAACGRHINRTDRLFEPSDGTLCAACMEALSLPHSRQRSGPAAQASARTAPPPAWACLPRLRSPRA